MEKMDIDGENENESESESENESETSMEKINSSDSVITINIIAAIYGHGALPQNKNKPYVFPPPPNNVTLNLLGFAPAGFCTIVSKQYETTVDHLLATDPTKVTPQVLTNEYNIHAKNYRLSRPMIKYPTLTSDTNIELFRYFKNYGRQQKGRSDKFYSGATDEEILKKTRIDGLTTSGALLKIYSVSIEDSDKNVLSLTKNVQSFTLSHNILLSQLVPIITNEIKSQYNTVIDSNPYKINIDLFDDTCNYTETSPTIAFLDNPSLKKSVKIEKGGNKYKKGKTRKPHKKGKHHKPLKKGKTRKLYKKGKKTRFQKH